MTKTERPDTKIEKKTLSRQSKNDKVKRQIRVDGLPEPDASNNDTLIFEQETRNVEAVSITWKKFRKLKTISGSENLTKRSRPRTVLLTLGNVWEA